MDFSQLSTEDLQALQAGDLSKVSTAGLQALSGKAAPAAKGPAPSALESVQMGVGDLFHGGAQLLTKALPGSVVDAGNRLNNWLVDKGAPLARIPESNLSSLVTGQPGGVDQMVHEREKAYQDQRAAAGDTGVDWWRIGGNVLNPATLASGGMLPAATSLLPRMAAGALVGGGSAALSPVTNGGDFWGEKGRQVAAGAVFGGLTPAVAAGASRVISPNASTNPDLALLRSEGVRPTIGQTLGGWANAMEEKAQSLPVVGDMIAAARGRAREEFNQAALNRVGASLGVKAEGTGQDAVAAMGNRIGAAYDAAKAQMGHFGIDRRGAAELANLQQLASGLQPDAKRVFDRVWATFNSEVSPNGSLTADAFKRVDSELGRLTRQFGGSTDLYQRQLGDAVQELQRIVVDNARRANPRAAELMDLADKAYAQLVRVEGASKAAMNNGGVFTPGQLQTSVRAADSSVRDRATARGTALMQDLSGAGQSVLGSKVPDSGTAGRLMLGGGTLMAGAADPSGAAIPALLAATAAYTRPVQALLTRLIASRQALAEPVAGLLNQASPALAPAGFLLGNQVVQ